MSADPLRLADSCSSAVALLPKMVRTLLRLQILRRCRSNSIYTHVLVNLPLVAPDYNATATVK